MIKSCHALLLHVPKGSGGVKVSGLMLMPGLQSLLFAQLHCLHFYVPSPCLASACIRQRGMRMHYVNAPQVFWKERHHPMRPESQQVDMLFEDYPFMLLACITTKFVLQSLPLSTVAQLRGEPLFCVSSMLETLYGRRLACCSVCGL